MRAALLIFAALVALPAMAGDCPTPPKLTCDQLRAKLAQRCEPEPPVVKIVEHATMVPAKCPDCPTVTVAAQPCPPSEKVYVPMPPEKPKPEGAWFAGGGPIYSRGWGLQGAVGYKWASGWMLLAGPNYIQRDDYNGTTTCPSHEGLDNTPHQPRCTPTPWVAPAGSPWGFGAILAHTF